MDKQLRNSLRNVVTQCRRLLEDAVAKVLQGQFGVHTTGKVEDAAEMGHLSEEDRQYREQILVHLEHIEKGSVVSGQSSVAKGIMDNGRRTKDWAVAQLMREVAFTHLNRLCAYKMMETRSLIREAVSHGLKSQGFLFYLADHPPDEQLWSGGKQDIAYRHFLEWLGETFSEDIAALFSPHDPANRLVPPHRVLEQV